MTTAIGMATKTMIPRKITAIIHPARANSLASQSLAHVLSELQHCPGPQSLPEVHGFPIQLRAHVFIPLQHEP